jgi:CRP/FNR family cyclic AMP-dependent transcriptional regulator
MRTDTDAPTSPGVAGGRLAETWFGAQLPPALINRLDAHVRRLELEPGEELLREGGPVDDLGIIEEGRVAIRLRVAGRGVATILTVEPGDVVGWSAIVPPHRSTSNVVALVRTTVMLIDAIALRAELAADPVTAVAVYRAVLLALSRRLTGTRLQFLDLFTAPGPEPW